MKIEIFKNNDILSLQKLVVMVTDTNGKNFIRRKASGCNPETRGDIIKRMVVEVFNMPYTNIKSLKK